MNTNELEYIIHHNRIGSNCLGVIPLNHLPFDYVATRPSYFVVNTDYCTEIGEHWVVVRNDTKHTCSHFDSLALPLKHEFACYYSKQNCSVQMLKKRMQPHDSLLCGYYCLYFLFKIESTNSDFELACEELTNDQLKNDEIVLSYVNNQILE